jgi:hypothetical protein
MLLMDSQRPFGLLRGQSHRPLASDITPSSAELQREELPVVTAATDRVPRSTEDPEHGSDDEQDHPDGPKDADACDQADQQQDEASHDHETEEYRSGAALFALMWRDQCRAG